MTVRFVVKANETLDVDGEYSIEARFADRVTSEIGKIRDGQLVLPGTGLRVEEDPADWRDGLLASPPSGANGLRPAPASSDGAPVYRQPTGSR